MRAIVRLIVGAREALERALLVARKESPLPYLVARLAGVCKAIAPLLWFMVVARA